MKAPASLHLQTPCKINLHLKVLGKRSNGYHDLETIFALIDYGDTLDFTLLPGGSGITSVKWDFSEGGAIPFVQELAFIPPEKNTVLRAAALFREHTGFEQDIIITICKRVPPGSGLGGGSSNAAFTLFGMNLLAGGLCSREELCLLAGRLGSDTPFFLCGAVSAWGTGCGEILEPLFPLPSYGLILVFPGFSSFTERAYALLDKSRGYSLLDPFMPGKDTLLDALKDNPARWPFSNDFLAVLDEREMYRAILASLWKSGALFAGLSGSGSACFGIYGSAEEAGRTAATFKGLCIRAGSFDNQAFPVDLLIRSTFFLRSGMYGSTIL
jgi:4-diphosphocytidyl-2-C-methyl-D-erythritol kinase